MITVTSAEAQNRFGQLLDTVQREPVTITRHGRTVAVMLRPQDLPVQNTASAQEAARQAGLNAISAFRGAGQRPLGASAVAQLLQDRQADRQREARQEEAAPGHKQRTGAGTGAATQPAAD